MTDNNIEDEGAKTVSLILKMNTSLKVLDLRCEEERKEKEKQKKE